MTNPEILYFTVENPQVKELIVEKDESKKYYKIEYFRWQNMKTNHPNALILQIVVHFCVVFYEQK